MHATLHTRDGDKQPLHVGREVSINIPVLAGWCIAKFKLVVHYSSIHTSSGKKESEIA